MPVYFAHGFRWPRDGFSGIRVHAIFHNLEDCSTEYIQNAHSQASILTSFRKAWPDVMRELDDEAHGGKGKGLTLLEEYDPEDEVSEMALSRPWAFVCDCVKVLPAGTVAPQEGVGGLVAPGPGAGPTAEKGKGLEGTGAEGVAKGPVLSMNVAELIAQGPGSTPKAWEALADLRDKIAEGEKIDWWIIYNGDPERAYDVTDDSGDGEEESEDASVAQEQSEEMSEHQQPSPKTFVPQEEATWLTSPARGAPAEARMEQRPKPSPKPKGMSPSPPIPPAKDRDKGKRTPGMRAFPPPEKAMPPMPAPSAVVTPTAKTETRFKKRLFGRK